MNEDEDTYMDETMFNIAKTMVLFILLACTAGVASLIWEMI